NDQRPRRLALPTFAAVQLPEEGSHEATLGLIRLEAERAQNDRASRLDDEVRQSRAVGLAQRFDVAVGLAKADDGQVARPATHGGEQAPAFAFGVYQDDLLAGA